jgi:hypothetical protein
MSRCIRPRNRFEAFSGLALSSLKSRNLKDAFICAPTVQQLFVGEAGEPGLKSARASWIMSTMMLPSTVHLSNATALSRREHLTGKLLTVGIVLFVAPT